MLIFPHWLFAELLALNVCTDVVVATQEDAPFGAAWLGLGQAKSSRLIMRPIANSIHRVCKR